MITKSAHLLEWLDTVDSTWCNRVYVGTQTRSTLLAYIFVAFGLTPTSGLPCREKDALLRSLAAEYERRGRPIATNRWEAAQVVAECQRHQAAMNPAALAAGSPPTVPAVAVTAAPAPAALSPPEQPVTVEEEETAYQFGCFFTNGNWVAREATTEQLGTLPALSPTGQGFWQATANPSFEQVDFTFFLGRAYLFNLFDQITHWDLPLPG